jgi:hypothetical protein
MCPCSRAATRQNECNSRNLDSPEQCHIPVFPQIAPLHFDNVPIPQLPPVSVNVIVPDDPFALPPAPVYLNGHEYYNLPQNLAEQVVYAQLYIYDLHKALQFCMNHRANLDLHRETMQLFRTCFIVVTQQFSCIY